MRFTRKQHVPNYNGKNIVEGYRRRYGVDRLTALVELRMLGQPITEEQIQKQRDNEIRLAADRAKQREARERKEALRCDWQDDNFSFIAGYTSGGFPYGITWEEQALIDEEDAWLERETPVDDLSDDPFAGSEMLRSVFRTGRSASKRSQ